MSSFLLIFSGIMSSLIFSSFGVKPPPLAFSLILIVASRLLHLYRTDVKTSMLKMKSFSTVRDTQRGTQSYMGKRRGRREIEVRRRRMRRNQKGREQVSQ